jgi:CHAD domain-containing protein
MEQQKAKPVNAKQTVEAAFHHILLNNLSAVHEWEPVAVKGKDIEGVHQMRVGLRRMRSALTVFRPALPRKVTTPLAREMRWAGKTLDHARDLDVYIADNLCSKGGKAHKRMRKIAVRHRKSVYGELRRFVGGKRYARFNTELSRWLDHRTWRKQLSRKQKKYLDCNVTAFAAHVLEQQRAKILKNVKNIKGLDTDALHRLRIDCKKLRYATEFFSPLYDKLIVKFTEHLKGLQDVLGTLHDVVIMTGLQKGLLKGEKSGKAAQFARKLGDKRAKQSKELTKGLKQRWDNFAQAKPPWKAASALI